MPSSLLSRAAGPIVLGTGLLILVAELLLLVTYDPLNRVEMLRDPIYLAGGVLYFVAFCGLVLSLMAAYERQAAQAGRLGLAGVTAAVVGTLFLGGDLWFETFAVPWLGDVAPAAFDEVGGMVMIGGITSYLLFAAGWVLFGIASLRARIFPAAISLGLVLGGAIGFQALLPPFGMPLGLALVALGGWLIRELLASATPTTAPALRLDVGRVDG
jgi:hypothetical protein